MIANEVYKGTFNSSFFAHSGMHPSQLVLLEGLDDPCVVLHLLAPRLRGRVLEEGLNGNAYI